MLIVVLILGLIVAICHPERLWGYVGVCFFLACLRSVPVITTGICLCGLYVWASASKGTPPKRKKERS